ncbi:antitoxin component of MazEF toxin-antitoxin module [Paenibacillus sp. LBL]|uniref:hypothetical protein n=1 Tax=Paenibacillus sp. LBL TaxID=2940563 RepID=UPI002475763E|nr:hypothetical protein [Paenibacillus sp. LBL]MDH6674271.1 antitoxin component of MazEF toxin-antitoxin module [Paenibacillus sp. LBL]
MSNINVPIRQAGTRTYIRMPKDCLEVLDLNSNRLLTIKTNGKGDFLFEKSQSNIGAKVRKNNDFVFPKAFEDKYRLNTDFEVRFSIKEGKVMFRLSRWKVTV